MMNKIALVRVLVFILSWVNQLLVNKGYQPLPVLSEGEVAAVITFVASVWVMFTDNSVKKVDK